MIKNCSTCKYWSPYYTKYIQTATCSLDGSVKYPYKVCDKHEFEEMEEDSNKDTIESLDKVEI
jgi:hypothetical protein